MCNVLTLARDLPDHFGAVRSQTSPSSAMAFGNKTFLHTSDVLGDLFMQGWIDKLDSKFVTTSQHQQEPSLRLEDKILPSAYSPQYPQPSPYRPTASLLHIPSNLPSPGTFFFPPHSSARLAASSSSYSPRLGSPDRPCPRRSNIVSLRHAVRQCLSCVSGTQGKTDMQPLLWRDWVCRHRSPLSVP
jgi:hypothetical protein